MFVLKSKLKDTIEKEVENKYGKRLGAIERKYKERERKIIQRKNQKIQTLIYEKNKIQKDASRFYDIYRQVPVRLLAIWQKIDSFKRIQMADKAQEVSISAAIESELESILRYQDKNELKIEKLLNNGGEE